MPRVQIKTEIDLDLDTAAEWFTELTDDEQARFFVAIEKATRTWPRSADNQWYNLGGHLKNCSCVNEETREMLRRWVFWMEESKSHE